MQECSFAQQVNSYRSLFKWELQFSGRPGLMGGGFFNLKPKKKESGNPSQPSIQSASRIGILDDHPIVASGLKELLQADQGFQKVTSFTSLADLEHFLSSQGLDLLILDLRLGHQDGLKMIAPLHARFQNLKILIFTMLDEKIHADRVIANGAIGYVMKQNAVDHIVTAVRAALAGSSFFNVSVQSVASDTSRKMPPVIPGAGDVKNLSKREIEVFRAVGQGLKTSEISGLLGIAVKTVEAHRENIKRKFGIDSVEKLISEATRWSIQDGG